MPVTKKLLDKEVLKKVSRGTKRSHDFTKEEDQSSETEESEPAKKTRIRRYGSHVCPECKGSFVEARNLKRHMETHRKKELGPYGCPFCVGVVYRHEGFLIRHWRDKCKTLSAVIEDRLPMEAAELRALVHQLIEPREAAEVQIDEIPIDQPEVPANKEVPADQTEVPVSEAGQRSITEIPVDNTQPEVPANKEVPADQTEVPVNEAGQRSITEIPVDNTQPEVPANNEVNHFYSARVRTYDDNSGIALNYKKCNRLVRSTVPYRVSIEIKNCEDYGREKKLIPSKLNEVPRWSIVLFGFFSVVMLAYFFVAHQKTMKKMNKLVFDAVSANFIYNYAIFPILLGALVLGATFAVLAVYKKHRLVKEIYEWETMEIVDKITDRIYASGHRGVVEQHLRDNLFPPARRSKRNIELWLSAVKFINTMDSRVRSERRLLDGVEYNVWIWVGSANIFRGWHGTSSTIPIQAPSRDLKFQGLFNNRFDAEGKDEIYSKPRSITSNRFSINHKPNELVST